MDTGSGLLRRLLEGARSVVAITGPDPSSEVLAELDRLERHLSVHRRATAGGTAPMADILYFADSRRLTRDELRWLQPRQPAILWFREPLPAAEVHRCEEAGFLAIHGHSLCPGLPQCVAPAPVLLQPAAGRPQELTDELVRRIHRLEGQLRGVERMLVEGTPSDQVLVQLAAVRAATGRAAIRLLLRDATFQPERVEALLESFLG